MCQLFLFLLNGEGPVAAAIAWLSFMRFGIERSQHLATTMESVVAVFVPNLCLGGNEKRRWNENERSFSC